MFKRKLAITLASVILCSALVAVGWTAETIPSEKLICQIDSSSWISETLTVSPDNTRVAYIAKKGDKEFAVIDGKEEKQYYDRAGYLTFSPDSKRVGYVPMTGGKVFVVVDGKEEKYYDNIMAGTLIFSPDSKRVAYAARMGGKQFVVVDGKEGKQYDHTINYPAASSGVLEKH